MNVEIFNLSMTYPSGKTALREINLNLSSPNLIGLLGPNGAGKSTLMKLLVAGLLPTEGVISVDGKPLMKQERLLKARLGYLPQSFGLFDELTVWQFLDYMAALKGIVNSKEAIAAAIQSTNLEEKQKAKIRTLSGGQRQRVGIAQAILGNPHFLIFDEPTVGLDPEERISFRNLFSQMAQDRLVLLSTHIVSDIEYVANDILLMKDGGLVTSGTVTELTESITEKVWTLEAAKKDVDSYMKKYKVSNVKTVPGGVSLRVLAAEKPSENAVLDEATLEDVFLHYFGEKAGGENA